MKELPSIVFIADKNYFIPSLTTLSSILSSTSSKINIFFIHNFKLPKKKNKYESYFKDNISSFHWIYFNLKIPSSLKSKNNYITRTAYAKFFLGDLLPTKLQKVIYLDGDLMINDNITNLWRLIPNNKVLAAVASPNFNRHDDLFMPKKCEAFNSGVMAVNLLKWRELNIGEKSLSFAIEYHKKMTLHDQDAFNAILYNNWKKLSLNWNVYHSIYFFPEDCESYSKKSIIKARRKPSIVHFNTSDKPWVEGSYHPKKASYNRILKKIEPKFTKNFFKWDIRYKIKFFKSLLKYFTSYYKIL